MPESFNTQSGYVPSMVPGTGSPIPQPNEGRRVLVVDDDPISRNIVRDLLSVRGFEVHGAEHPQAALQKVSLHRYDLLILDIFLPGLDGRVLHGSIEKLNPALARRTIFISHWDPSGAIGEYILAHGPFLKKPFTAEELMNAIQATMGVGSMMP